MPMSKTYGMCSPGFQSVKENKRAQQIPHIRGGKGGMEVTDMTSPTDSLGEE